MTGRRTDAWGAASRVARETVKLVASAPTGSRVVDLERQLGEPLEVVRTLNRLQQAGLVRIQVEPGSLELTVLPVEGADHSLQELVRRLS